MGEDDQRQKPQAAGDGLDEHHGALADPVGEHGGDGGAQGVGDGERTGGEAARGIRARGAGHQQQGTHLAHRQG